MIDRMLVRPVFVHCHECQVRTSPSGRSVLIRGEFIPFSSSALTGLCVAVLRERGALYVAPAGVVA
jgi:hypothetical protein